MPTKTPIPMMSRLIQATLSPRFQAPFLAFTSGLAIAMAFPYPVQALAVAMDVAAVLWVLGCLWLRAEQRRAKPQVMGTPAPAKAKTAQTGPSQEERAEWAGLTPAEKRAWLRMEMAEADLGETGFP